MTAVDIVIAPDVLNGNSDITFLECSGECLPFDDKSFDVSVCAHTLEHVLNFEKCVSELRRVTKKQLHIIVPLQRPAKYTPDLHISYFPYPESFLVRIKPQANYRYEILDGDLYYMEDYTFS